MTAIEIGGQRLRAQTLKQLMRLARHLPEQAAEAARVVEAQHPAIVQGDIDMIMRAHRHIAIQHAGYFLLDYCSTHPFRNASWEELDGIIKQIHAAHAQPR